MGELDLSRGAPVSLVHCRVSVKYMKMLVLVPSQVWDSLARVTTQSMTKEVQSNHSPANDSGRLRLSISKYQYFCYRFAKPMSQGVLDLWNSTWDTVSTTDMMTA